MKTADLRADIPFLEEVVYLDAASTTPTPKRWWKPYVITIITSIPTQAEVLIEQLLKPHLSLKKPV